jgi:hypothetical protein
MVNSFKLKKTEEFSQTVLEEPVPVIELTNNVASWVYIAL